MHRIKMTERNEEWKNVTRNKATKKIRCSDEKMNFHNQFFLTLSNEL